MVKNGVLFILMGLGLTAAAEPQKLRLSQKDVAEMVLRQGFATSETNLTFMQERLKPAEARKDFDWYAEARGAYEFDKTEPQSTVGASYRRLLSGATLTKKISTGSKFGLTYDRKSQNAAYDFVTSSTPTGPTRTTSDVFGLSFEQNLLNNSFGRSDRAKLRAADRSFDSAAVARADSLESVVLETIRSYWDAFVAKETFKEALSSRERYKSLVTQVRRKSGYGYANPAELTQVQAEYETQEQNVKTNSTDYLMKLETLTTRLNLPPDTEIDFAVETQVPAVPKLVAVDPEGLRPVRAQKLKVESAEESLRSARSTSYPSLDFIGALKTSGYDEVPGTAFATAASGSHPYYYAGLKLAYTFGSGFQNEDIVNKKASKELEETRLARARMETHDKMVQSERSVQSNYAIVQSAMKQNELRAKAVQELTRSYGQGRTDIQILITAINNQFNTEVALSRAIGNYQIALNEWAAARDELIPESKGGEK